MSIIKIMEQETPMLAESPSVVPDTSAAPEPSVTETPTTPVVLDEKKDTPPYGDSVGQVKWFNSKLGYGFITFSSGDNKGKDIFVHHRGVKPLNSGYHTLTPGEYVAFNVVTGQNGLQAEDVTGICGGPLMCDIVCKPFKPPALNPVSGTQVPVGGTIPVPPRKPGKPTSRQGPKNKLKYSREGREIMKAMKAGVPPPPQYTGYVAAASAVSPPPKYPQYTQLPQYQQRGGAPPPPPPRRTN